MLVMSSALLLFLGESAKPLWTLTLLLRKARASPQGSCLWTPLDPERAFLEYIRIVTFGCRIGGLPTLFVEFWDYLKCHMKYL